MTAEKSPSSGFFSPLGLFVPTLALLLVFSPPSAAVLQGSPNVLEHFPDDFYKIEGSPDTEVSLERSNVYQGEDTSLFLTLINRGSITSIKVNEEPAEKAPEEVYASELELELEHARTTAQEISVSLEVPYPANDAPLEVKRKVAYAGTLLDGQVSPRLEFPVEVYENTPPGDYTLKAVVNYTYQWDVAVEPKSSRPQNPDIYYLYDSKSQVVPLTLRVERKSGVELGIWNVSPNSLDVGSEDNVLKVAIENVGDDTARDLVARLRPESGVYVSVDESPIPTLSPGERAELVYKVDVSKDAVPEKLYMLTLLFEFSDSYQEDLTDTEHAYIMIEERGVIHLLGAAIILAVLAAGVLMVIRKKRGRG